MKIKLDEFTIAYIQAALWSSTDLGFPEFDGSEDDRCEGNPLDENYSINSFEAESLERIVRDCKKFQEDNKTDIENIPDWNGVSDSYGRSHYSNIECAGHDFWMTRNGHGVGFWDRDYPKDMANRLTESAKSFRECYIYSNDDDELILD